jgi:hypothetical protein
MSASPAVRSLRAAVFAVLCVLLAAGGHGLASGQAPPLWADAAGLLPVFAAGVLLGGRERSLVGIGGGMLAAQAGLHLAFEAAESRTRTAMTMHGTSMAQARMSHGHMVRAHMSHPHAWVAHTTIGHVAAALLATWWLRRGEAALWSLLRRAAVLVPGLAAWWRVRAAPSPEPVRGGVRRSVAALRPLRQVLLRHAVSRRGPPAGIPYTP